jgi:hypothetical protein
MRNTVLALAVALCSTSAFAGLLTTDPGTGVTTIFPDATLVTDIPGPVVYGGFTITGNPTFSYGSSTSYGLGTNGVWDLNNVATDSATSSAIINLGGLFGLVGGFMNYDPAQGTDATITALAADGTTVLATFDLESLAPISTPGATDGGAFRGISLASNNIAFLELTGDYLLTNSIEVGAAGTGAVPEPGTLGLGALALSFAAFLKLKK